MMQRLTLRQSLCRPIPALLIAATVGMLVWLGGALSDGGGDPPHRVLKSLSPSASHDGPNSQVSPDLSASARSPAPPERPAATHSATPAMSSVFVIAGRVVDEFDKPIDTFSVNLLFIGERHQLDKAKPIDISGVGHGGIFKIDVPLAGPWRVYARCGAVVSAPVVAATKADYEAVLVMPSLASIEGIVIDSWGTPIADAEVQSYYPNEDALGSFAWDRPAVPTDASGAFRIADLCTGEVGILARHDQFADAQPVSLRLSPGACAKGVRVVLTQGGQINGRLAPSLLGAKVALIGQSYSVRPNLVSPEATGRFTIDHIPPQEYLVGVLKRDGDSYATGSRFAIEKAITVREGQCTEVSLGSTRSLRLRGLVRVAGVPAEGLGIRPYSGTNENYGNEVVTGPDGRFEVSLAGPGRYSFDIAGSSGEYSRCSWETVEADDGQCTFDLPGGSVRGVVITKTGRRLEDVGVTLVADRSTFNDASNATRKTRTAHDGSFAFAWVSPGVYTLRAPDGLQEDEGAPHVPYGRCVLAHIALEANQTQVVELRLATECWVLGRVTEVGGLAVPNAQVSVSDSFGVALTCGEQEARANGAGRFLIENLAPGRYRFLATCRGFESGEALVVVEDGEAQEATIVLRRQ